MMALAEDGLELLDDPLATAIVAHARREFPREACGFIVQMLGKRWYVEVVNVAPGTESFRMADQAWSTVEDIGTIEALVHSHPHGDPTASPADIAACSATGVLWIIVAVPEVQWNFIEPED
jgi:proteasome lid subunit RPN8/RPN11